MVEFFSFQNNKVSLMQGFKRALTIDFRTLALFRVFIAGILLADLYMRGQYFTAFFTDQGVLPRFSVVNWFGPASYSLHFISGSVFFAGLLFALSVIAALCMLLGYRTRLATFVTWLLLLSLHHRTSILSNGGDDLMRLLIFWGIFLPLGARCSIDSALEKAKPYSSSGLFTFATVAILMQVLYVYWVGALLKTDAKWTTDFTAVYYALSAEHYATSLGIWFASTFDYLLPYITAFVLYIEQYGPLFMLSPVLLLWMRTPVLILLIAMHLGFVLLLNVAHFPFVSICSLLLFLPKEFWDRIATFSWFNRDKGVTVFYDQNCEFCLKTVMLIKHLCLLRLIKVLPAQENEMAAPILEKHDSWVVQQADGKTVIEWSALAYLISLSPLFFWLSYPLKLMVKLKVGDKLYHFIGNRRMSLGRFTSRYLPWRETDGRTSLINHVTVTLFMVFCFYSNMQSIFPSVLQSEPAFASHVKRALGLWQIWDMFAPGPLQQTRWPIIEGTTNSGERVDIFRQKIGPASTTKPAHILSEYEYSRWRKHYRRLYYDKYTYLRQHYVKYECRRWNENKPYEEQISTISLAMGTEVTLLDSSAETEYVRSMGDYSC